MRKMLLVAAVICVASLQPVAAQEAKPATPAAAAYKYKTPKLNRAEIDALLAKPEALLVIDVRRPDEVSKIGSFPVYLSVQAKDLEKYLSSIPKERSIVTLSNHAGRAGQTADFLAEHGFKVVGAIGIQNYEEEGGKAYKVELPTQSAGAEKR